jgi:hypothetical protein
MLQMALKTTQLLITDQRLVKIRNALWAMHELVGGQ